MGKGVQLKCIRNLKLDYRDRVWETLFSPGGPQLRQTSGSTLKVHFTVARKFQQIFTKRINAIILRVGLV
jgi:hypothetical protein